MLPESIRGQTLVRVCPYCYGSDVLLHIKCRIHGIHILLIQFFPQQLYSFTETLEVYDFSFPQEFNHIVHIRIIGKPENIIVSHPCFLFWERIA